MERNNKECLEKEPSKQKDYRKTDQPDKALVCDSHKDKWENGYEHLVAYKEAHNDSVWVPKGYVSEDGFKLGNWVSRQRSQKKQKRLSMDRENKLNALGMHWGTFVKNRWENGYEHLVAYKETHNGSVCVPQKYVSEDGFKLGEWVSRQRRRKKRLEREGKNLPEDEESRLNALGMIESPRKDRWENGYEHLVAYKEAHKGSVCVSQKYVSEDGFKLGKWVYNQRSQKKQKQLSKDRESRLNALGMIWSTFVKDRWENGYEHLVAYKEAHNGNVWVPMGYVSEDGFKLGNWVSRQRSLKKQKGLSMDRESRLNALGMHWGIYYFESPRKDRWENGYEHLVAYKEAHNGDVRVPTIYVSEDGFKLGNWVSNQRSQKKQKRLSMDRENKLNALGMHWGTFVKNRWENGYEHLVAYKEAHNGSVCVPQKYVSEDGFKLGEWVSRQRSQKKQKQLSKDRESRLNALGMIWSKPLR